jgi:hypothetical protein
MCKSLKIQQTSQTMSRPPRADDVCALFAGVHVLISAARKWRQRRQQPAHACLCH